jgi:gamma-glutamylcyclotransferase (GGCT)/AIG2-like uncharacterized protein YtfP
LSEEKEYLFAYGTLKCSPYKDLLGDYIFVGSSSVKGKLYLVEGTYPGFVEGQGIVLGEIYLVDNALFPKIDEYEGSEYQRKRILTDTNVVCWIYEYIRECSKTK